MRATEHIDTIRQQTLQVIHKAEEFSKLDPEVLRWKNDPATWSILECLEHLNLYGDFYLPAITDALDGAPGRPVKDFKPGMLGGWLAASVAPRKTTKMKTFPDKDPARTSLDERVIERFLRQQEQFLRLLERARQVDLNKVRTRTFLSRFLRLRLGDTLQFMINHTMRHMQQAERVRARMEAGVLVQ